MGDLKRRFLVGSGLVICTAAVLWGAVYPIFPYVLAATLSVLAAIALWEYRGFALVKGVQIDFFACSILGTAQLFSFLLGAKHPSLAILPVVCLFAALIVFFALHFPSHDGAILRLALSVFGLVYIAVPIGMILGIFYLPQFPAGEGRWWVAYLLAVTKMSDVGGYFGGYFFGKRKLALAISPHKTVEGALIGLLFALATSYGFYWLSQEFSRSYFSLGPMEWVVLGALFSVLGQFGDLAESLLKRDANKKDSNVLPGLGGILDSIDSLLFNIPVMYLYLIYAGHFLG